MSLGRKRLLHVFSTFDPGGPQVRAARLFARMQPSWENLIVAMDGRYGTSASCSSARAFERLESPRAAWFGSTLARALKILRATKPDLVLTYNWGAIESVLAARLARLPLVHHEDGFGPEEIDRFLLRRIWARRLLLRSARALVVPSLALVRVARERWRLPGGQLFHLPNGVDTAQFQPSRERAPGPLVIGTVGGLRAVKNQALLLDAFAACPRARAARLHIVGEGPERTFLEQQAARLGIADRVAFLGASEQCAPLYRSFDIFALSSITEQMPIALLEAMASALPVVSTRVGDIESMLPEKNRPFLVESGSAPGLADALERLLADPLARAELGAANRQRVLERFEEAECLKRFLRLYGRALQG